MWVQVTVGEPIRAAVETSDAMIKLQNVTVQNISESVAFRIMRMLSIIMQDVRVSYSQGIKVFRSNVTTHGKFLLTHNTATISTVQLHASVTLFYGDFKFLEIK